MEISNMNKKYKTVNIDEAAYYAVKGHGYKVKNFGERSGEWEFVDEPTLQKTRKQFWGGKADVNLHKWMALRWTMKNEQRTVPMTIRKRFGVRQGEKYYYLNEKDNVCVAYMGPHIMHQERKEKGNFFLTSDEALDSRSKK